MFSHLIFDKAGVYSPRICPRAILWQRVPADDPDPVCGVFVPSVENAQKFAQVLLIRDGVIVAQFAQKEIDSE